MERHKSVWHFSPEPSSSSLSVTSQLLPGMTSSRWSGTSRLQENQDQEVKNTEDPYINTIAISVTVHHLQRSWLKILQHETSNVT